MAQSFSRIEKVFGELNLPGDKSISHRAVMFASLAKGKSTIKNLSDGEDVKSTRKCFQSLGIKIYEDKNYVVVEGNGFKGLQGSHHPLDAGNSGTTTRLISGILAAQDFESEIIGDESLSRRPMKRIITPLSEMGARIIAAENFTLPMKILPSEKLKSIVYELPVASAQVKSAILLAGLHLDETTRVVEKIPSRDHTERMLALKTVTNASGRIISVSKNDYPEPKEYFVPSDISTAAFFIVLTLLSKDGELKIKNVSLNETRTGIITILKKMGADIQTENFKITAGEPIGDIVVRSSKLYNVEIGKEIIPNVIDEIPILSIAGIFAEGNFIIEDAGELRGKETDRINAICHNLKLLGLDVEEFPDGFAFNGDVKKISPIFESFNDHRIAMSFGILSMLLKDGGTVNNFNCVNISNPNFLPQVRGIIK